MTTSETDSITAAEQEIKTPKKTRSVWSHTIDTLEDAEETLRAVARAWYTVAALALVASLIALADFRSAPVLSDIPFFLVSGYYLPRRKSRAFAIGLLLYAVFLTGYNLAHGDNFLLQLFLAWIGYLGVKATFVYHKHMHSKVAWNGALIVGGGAFVTLLAWLGLSMYLDLHGRFGMPPPLSDALLINLMLAAMTICCLQLSKKFPLIKIPQSI
jgi:hypothetical protein